MRLDVGKAAIEQRLRAVDRQRLDLVRRRAALIKAAARIAFGIFVGEDRSLRLQHRLRHDVFRRDQFDLQLLAVQFMLHRCRDRGIDGIDAFGDRKRVEEGKSVAGGVNSGGGPYIKNKTYKRQTKTTLDT